jgi:glycerol-3-phosphate dehydrogenase (NAD(P)+)
MVKKYQVALVIGGGAFGTSVANLISESFERVYVLVRSNDVFEGINSGENSIYLPNKKLNKNITAILNFEDLGNDHKSIQLIISGLPTSAISPFCQEHHEQIRSFLVRSVPVVCLSKGIDPDSLELPDDLYFDLFPKHRDLFTFLSGPSFASEIMDKQITLASLAGRSRPVLIQVADMLSCPYFKVFLAYDIKGVLLGGALKNILAISGGIIEGLGFNHNTRAAMITRGIAEMLRFGKVLNARPETFYGLSGMGDLILTTTSDLSRNKSFGIELAKGRKAKEIISSQRSVVEGYKTALAAHRLSEKYEIRARIFNGIFEVLYNDKEPREIIERLMLLPAKFEID